MVDFPEKFEAGFPGKFLLTFRRGLRGRWRILGVGGGGGYCHFGLLAAAMAPIVTDMFENDNFEKFVIFVGF